MKKNEPVILVIEDHEEVAALAAYFLRRANYRPVVAPDGIEGLRLARTLSPALILCDAGLPELNGPKLLAVLRASSVTAAIPFVLMSGFESARGSFPQPEAFLPKPFRMEELLTLVGTLVGPTKQWNDADTRTTESEVFA